MCPTSPAKQESPNLNADIFSNAVKNNEDKPEQVFSIRIKKRLKEKIAMIRIIEERRRKIRQFFLPLPLGLTERSEREKKNKKLESIVKTPNSTFYSNSESKSYRFNKF